MQTFAVIEANDVVCDADLGFGVVGIVALLHLSHFEIQKGVRVDPEFETLI
jgi:hypothetical protein